jgi:hypothetical protein
MLAGGKTYRRYVVNGLAPQGKRKKSGAPDFRLLPPLSRLDLALLTKLPFLWLCRHTFI